jgi:Domain of unknown function (DUF4347)
MSLSDNAMLSDSFSEPVIELHRDMHSHEETFDIVPLVYDDSVDTNAITNILLIDDTVQEHQQFVSGCNATTFPIVYNYHSDRKELKALLARKFSTIQRIAFVFHNASMNSKLFLNNQCFFSGSESPFSENVQVLVDIIRDFGVGHVDYLACNSLEYDSWKQYYELLKTASNVVIGASDDATGNVKYGGDWVMESTNEDIKAIYFDESIDEYTKTLATMIDISGNLSSGNNIYIKQLTTNDNPIYWSTSDNSANDITTGGGSWNKINTNSDWQVTLKNANATPDASNMLVVTFLTDITIRNVNNYFIIGSNYVTIDGGNKTVDVSGVTNYQGLIQNGTTLVNGFSNITVTNINTKITGTTTLASQAGYICQSYFCKGSFGTNTIMNCTNSGPVSGNYTGGITGYRGAYLSVGTNKITNCSNNGNVIGQSAGGIAGFYFAESTTAGSTNTISNCTNSGPVSGPNAAGIAGSYFAISSSGTNKISDCSNNGIISGPGAGGIAGYNFAQSTTAGSTNTIERCLNTRDVSGNSSGGIAGPTCFRFSAGTNTISNCSNNGNISGQAAGGISGEQFAQSTTAGSTNTIERCSNSGNISGPSAGGIAGISCFRLSAGTNTISNCTNNGIILGNSAGGIAGYSFALSSSGTNKISDCSNNGIISGQSAGGIAGESFARLTTAGSKNTIETCSNTGNILALSAGGIAGRYFAVSSSGKNTISNCSNNGIISGVSAGGITGKFTGYNSSGTNTITNCANNGDISGNFTGGIAGGAIAYTDVSNIRPSLIISNSYSIGVIRNTTGTGGICAGFDGKDFNDSSNIFFDISYSTTATATIKNCYALDGNMKSSTQSDKVSFNITNTYEANGSWSSNYALRNLLLKDASNVYIWAYQKLNGLDQTNSPFTLLSLNPAFTRVGEISPTITFTLQPKTYGDASFIIQDLSSNSPADFSYNSSIPAVATINGRTVTIKGAGSSILTVRQDACGNYTDGSANRQLNVSKATTIISNFSFTSSKTYGDASFVLTRPETNSNADLSYNSYNTAVATISGNTVTIVGAGSTMITAYQKENSNFTDGSANRQLVVNQATSTITFSVPSPKTFGVDTSFTIQDLSSNSPADFSYNSSNPAVATINGRTITIKGAGDTMITITQDACGNYTGGSAIAFLKVDSQVPPAINFKIPKKIYGDFPFRLDASSTNTRSLFTYSVPDNNVVTITGDIVTILNAGTVIITASQTEIDGFTAGSANATLTINNETPSTIDYSITQPTKTYTVTTGESVLIKPRKYNATNQDYFWNIQPSLPEGLKFSKRTGKIRGVPVSPMEPTQYTIRLTVGSETQMKKILLEIVPLQQPV